MRSPKSLVSAAGALLAVVAFACSGGNAPGAPTSDSSTSNPTAGRLSIRLTDSPFSDARALLVTFSEVSVHRADPGEWKTIPFVTGSSRTCDLKQLKDAIDLLGVGSLPAVGDSVFSVGVAGVSTVGVSGVVPGGNCPLPNPRSRATGCAIALTSRIDSAALVSEDTRTLPKS